MDINKGQSLSGKAQDVRAGQAVTVVVNVKDVDKSKDTAKLNLTNQV